MGSETQTSRRRSIMLATAIAVALTAAAWAQDVRLLRSTSVEAIGPIVLADVARVGADRSGTMDSIVVVEDPTAWAGGSSWRLLEASDIRAALRDAGVPLGRVAITGSGTVVRLRGSAPGPVPVETAPAPAATPAESDFTADASLPTPAAVVTREIAARLGVGLDELRVTFESPDRAFLEQRLAGRVPAVTLLNRPSGARTSAEVVLMRGETVADRRRVSLRVEILRDVTVLLRDVDRRETLSPEDVQVERRWLAPGRGDLLTIDALDTLPVASRRLDAGSVVYARDIRLEAAVRRGSLVNVVLRHGAFQVTTAARADADAAIGDRVQLRLARDGRPFAATVVGKGRAVAVPSPDAEQGGNG